MVAATQAITQSGSASGAQAFQLGQVSMRQASEAARASASSFAHDYYDRRMFDSYLKFASVEDEDEYRRREQERKQAIEKALAERTPEGDLRALDLSIEQLKDAGAHGAKRSPDYQPELDNMTEHRAALKTALSPQVDTVSAKAESGKPAPDPIAALKAAGVSLASDTDAAKAVPRDGTAQRGIT